MLFVIQNLLTLERLLSFSSVAFRVRLLFICGLYKRDKGKILSAYGWKAHGVTIVIGPLIINPV